MSKIIFVDFNSEEVIETIESNIIPRQEDVVTITKGKHLVRAIGINYVEDYIIVLVTSK